MQEEEEVEEEEVKSESQLMQLNRDELIELAKEADPENAEIERLTKAELTALIRGEAGE